MGDFVIEDYQDKQLDEGLSMPLNMENSNDDSRADLQVVLQQPKPREKLILNKDDGELSDHFIVPQ